MSAVALSRGKRLRDELPVHAALFLPMASIVFLLYYLFSNTLKPTADFYDSEIAFPTGLSFDALFAAATDGGMLLALRNSVVLTAASVLLALVLGAAASYALARLDLPGKRLIFVAMLVPMSLAPMILAVPLFAQLAQVGLINTFAGGILIYVGLRLSFTVFVLEGVFRELPDELFDAARVDGAGPWAAFVRVLLPVAAPGLAAVSVFNMLEIWNDLLIGLLFLSTPETIPLAANVVGFQQRFSANPQTVFAGLAIGALPMLLAYGLLQRFFVKGLMGGAFK